MRLTFKLTVAEIREMMGDRCVWDGGHEWDWLEPYPEQCM